MGSTGCNRSTGRSPSKIHGDDDGIVMTVDQMLIRLGVGLHRYVASLHAKDSQIIYVGVQVCVCMSVCICVRERERGVYVICLRYGQLPRLIGMNEFRCCQQLVTSSSAGLIDSRHTAAQYSFTLKLGVAGSWVARGSDGKTQGALSRN